jgi:hypothetical protein
LLFRSFGRPIASIAALKCVASLLVLSTGFRSVSDDDFSRTVIAEQFAHAPRLDPSGTSWLPFPFWLNGAAMLAFGRSVGVARGVAFAAGIAAPVLFYLALRVRKVKQPEVLALLPFLAPWLSLLSVATVPEALTAGLAGAALVGLSSREPLSPRDLGFALAAACAALSRYDAWPIAASCAGLVLVRVRRPGVNALGAGVLLLALLGPVAWMLWNSHAHGDALHFLARVSRFRQSQGQAEGSLFEKALFFPRALVTDAPDLAVFAVISAVACIRSHELRARWGGVLLGSAATLAFLIVGSLKDGAPTHHPARALILLGPPLYAAGLDSALMLTNGLRERIPATLRRAVPGAIVIVGLALSAVAQRALVSEVLPFARATQLREGERLRAEGASWVVLAPCKDRYDHLAIMAAFGAPERVTLDAPRAVGPEGRCEALVLEPAASH